MSFPNVSSDLIWEIVRHNNAYLVKRKNGGGAQFSTDPYNLTNRHSRKHAGFVNEKAVGIKHNEERGVVVTSKTKQSNKPVKSSHTAMHGGNRSSRKIYKGIANSTAKSGYRPDLRQAAIARASAIRRSQRPVKPDQEKKLRGSKARKAEAEKA